MGRLAVEGLDGGGVMVDDEAMGNDDDADEEEDDDDNVDNDDDDDDSFEAEDNNNAEGEPATAESAAAASGPVSARACASAFLACLAVCSLALRANNGWFLRYLSKLLQKHTGGSCSARTSHAPPPSTPRFAAGTRPNLRGKTWAAASSSNGKASARRRARRSSRRCQRRRVGRSTRRSR